MEIKDLLICPRCKGELDDNCRCTKCGKQYESRFGIYNVLYEDLGEEYTEEYKKLLVDVIGCSDLPILFNINVGHSLPRCIIPFGVNAVVDVQNQVIRFVEG